MLKDKISAITLRLAKNYTDEQGGGGGQGDGNYNNLSHLPLFNGKTWKGTMTTKDVGLGDLAEKDDAEATYTPAGAVSISEGADTTTTVASVKTAGTLPSFSIEEETLVFSAGALPTTENKTVVTASGTRTASFSGTEATITVS